MDKVSYFCLNSVKLILTLFRQLVQIGCFLCWSEAIANHGSFNLLSWHLFNDKFEDWAQCVITLRVPVSELLQMLCDFLSLTVLLGSFDLV